MKFEKMGQKEVVIGLMIFTKNKINIQKKFFIRLIG
jgi:hypothetical protein